MKTEAQRGARQPDQFLIVGRVLRPHGVRGGLLVEAASELIHTLQGESEVYLGQAERPEQIRSLRPHRKQFLLYLYGCTDRDAADLFRELDLRIPLEAAEPLPEGVYYHWQILGLEVHTVAGDRLGEVASILTTGANDVYVVKDEAGGELLLPAIESVIKAVDLESGRILVELIPGLLPPK